VTEKYGQARGKIETLITQYFLACGYGTAADIASHFEKDAVIYDTNHPPIRGAGSIGEFWLNVRERYGEATWHVDSIIESEDSAAIEWTMRGNLGSKQLVYRGSEHYHVKNGLIIEIRQYWNWKRNELTSGLVDYLYDNIYDMDKD
jgi:hypothetical protein